MRNIISASIVAIVLGLSLSASQKPEDGAIPPSKKGDTLVVRGCVSGSLLKDLRAQKTDPVTGGETAVVYRMTGEKKLLQIIQKEHQDQVLDVTGVLPPIRTSPARPAASKWAKPASSSASAARKHRCPRSLPRIHHFASPRSKSSGQAAPRTNTEI